MQACVGIWRYIPSDNGKQVSYNLTRRIVMVSKLNLMNPTGVMYVKCLNSYLLVH